MWPLDRLRKKDWIVKGQKFEADTVKSAVADQGGLRGEFSFTRPPCDETLLWYGLC